MGSATAASSEAGSVDGASLATERGSEAVLGDIGEEEPSLASLPVGPRPDLASAAGAARSGGEAAPGGAGKEPDQSARIAAAAEPDLAAQRGAGAMAAGQARERGVDSSAQCSWDPVHAAERSNNSGSTAAHSSSHVGDAAADERGRQQHDEHSPCRRHPLEQPEQWEAGARDADSADEQPLRPAAPREGCSASAAPSAAGHHEAEQGGAGAASQERQHGDDSASPSSNAGDVGHLPVARTPSGRRGSQGSEPGHLIAEHSQVCVRLAPAAAVACATWQHTTIYHSMSPAFCCSLLQREFIGCAVGATVVAGRLWARTALEWLALYKEDFLLSGL